MPARAASTNIPETPAHPALSSWALNQKLEELERDYGRDQKKKPAEIESSSIGNPSSAAIGYRVERLEQYVDGIESVYKAEIEAGRVANTAEYWHKVLPSVAAKINSLGWNLAHKLWLTGGGRPGEQAAVEEAQRRLSRLRADIDHKLASALACSVPAAQPADTSTVGPEAILRLPDLREPVHIGGMRAGDLAKVTFRSHN